MWKLCCVVCFQGIFFKAANAISAPDDRVINETIRFLQDEKPKKEAQFLAFQFMWDTGENPKSGGAGEEESQFWKRFALWYLRRTNKTENLVGPPRG